MSITPSNLKDKVTLQTEVIVITKDSLARLLDKIYDELTGTRVLNLWFGASCSLLSIGATGLGNWLFSELTFPKESESFGWDYVFEAVYVSTKPKVFFWLAMGACLSLFIWYLVSWLSKSYRKDTYVQKHLTSGLLSNTVGQITEISATPVDLLNQTDFPTTPT